MGGIVRAFMGEDEYGDYVTFEDFELATKARDGIFSQITESLRAENAELREIVMTFLDAAGYSTNEDVTFKVDAAAEKARATLAKYPQK